MQRDRGGNRRDEDDAAEKVAALERELKALKSKNDGGGVQSSDVVVGMPVTLSATVDKQL